MKKLLSPSNKILMYIGVLLVVIGVPSLTSCRTTKTTTLTATTTRDSVHSDLHFFVKNTIVHDSIYIHERSDTVFVERWSIRYRDRIVAHTDTVRIVERDSIPFSVEVPVEVPTPIPRFYRVSTWGFWIAFLALIAFIALRLWLHKKRVI